MSGPMCDVGCVRLHTRDGFVRKLVLGKLPAAEVSGFAICEPVECRALALRGLGRLMSTLLGMQSCFHKSKV